MPEENQKEEITVLGKTTFRNYLKTFGIKTDDRRRHIYIIGKTGMGKTVLLENMIYSDIMNGHGCCYVDPHGDTAERLLSCIPSSRINDVIYFNPSDIDFPISFNVLEKVDARYRHLVSSGLIGVFKKLWAESWGPRLEYILRNAILALLDYPGSTLLGINRILIDKVYRKKVVDKITDPVVKSFWVDEYPKWSERVLQEVISPIQNKVGQFLSTSLLRNIVGQVSSTLDLRKVMDERKIVILNLSKGRIGEDSMMLLGSMIITKIQLAAMSRVDIPEEERHDFYLYVDELQNFVTESFANILSEARKYRLNLTVAHQYIEQLGEIVGPAIFGNVGTMITFRVGASDAEFLVKEYEPFLAEEDLVALPKYNFYIKLMIDGVTSDPFSAIGLPPLIRPQGNEEKIIKVSRERYAKPREVVEDKIRRWAESKEAGEQESETEGAAGAKKEKFMGDGDFDAVCDGCNQNIKVRFAPDNVRATYCPECLKKMRAGELPKNKPKEKRPEIKAATPVIPARPVMEPVIKVEPKPVTPPPPVIKAEPKPAVPQKPVIKVEPKPDIAPKPLIKVEPRPAISRPEVQSPKMTERPRIVPPTIVEDKKTSQPVSNSVTIKDIIPQIKLKTAAPTPSYSPPRAGGESGAIKKKGINLSPPQMTQQAQPKKRSVNLLADNDK